MFKKKSRIATMLCLKNVLLEKQFNSGRITTDELNVAEHEILKLFLLQSFPEVYKLIRKKTDLPKRHPMSGLNPFLDEKT